MMLVGGGLRILHATLHERIHHALARLTPELDRGSGAGLRLRAEAARRNRSRGSAFSA